MVSLRSVWLKALKLSALALLAAMPAHAQDAVVRQLPESQQQVQLSFAPLAAKAAPAVVNIYTSRTVKQFARSPLFNDPLFQRFFGSGIANSERTERSLGSGVLIGADGMIVTSNHVIKDSEEVTVVLSDRREFQAKILLNDERSDLALLKIDAGKEGLPHLDLHNSDALQVGDLVLAIGNPFGVGQTVTSGIISGLARSTTVGVADYQFFIQTDAAINPGNSGGALIDMQGRLIGVNTAIYSTSGASNGIGFAIPANMVQTVLDSARAGNKQVVRPWLGVAVQSVTNDISESLGLPYPQGVLVKGIAPDSPAATAGIQVGDVILTINGYEIGDKAAMQFRAAITPLNSPASFKIWRSGKASEYKVKMMAPPEKPARDVRMLNGMHPLNGVTVLNLSPAVAIELNIDNQTYGVVVTSAVGNRMMQAGDILIELNGAKITSTAQLEKLVTENAKSWNLIFKRGGQTMQLQIR